MKLTFSKTLLATVVMLGLTACSSVVAVVQMNQQLQARTIQIQLPYQMLIPIILTR